jgi:hypothetical protein
MCKQRELPQDIERDYYRLEIRHAAFESEHAVFVQEIDRFIKGLRNRQIVEENRPILADEVISRLEEIKKDAPDAWEGVAGLWMRRGPV